MSGPGDVAFLRNHISNQGEFGATVVLSKIWESSDGRNPISRVVQTALAMVQFIYCRVTMSGRAALQYVVTADIPGATWKNQYMASDLIELFKGATIEAGHNIHLVVEQNRLSHVLSRSSTAPTSDDAIADAYRFMCNQTRDGGEVTVKEYDTYTDSTEVFTVRTLSWKEGQWKATAPSEPAELNDDVKRMLRIGGADSTELVGQLKLHNGFLEWAENVKSLAEEASRECGGATGVPPLSERITKAKENLETYVEAFRSSEGARAEISRQLSPRATVGAAASPGASTDGKPLEWATVVASLRTALRNLAESTAQVSKLEADLAAARSAGEDASGASGARDDGDAAAASTASELATVRAESEQRQRRIAQLTEQLGKANEDLDAARGQLKTDVEAARSAAQSEIEELKANVERLEDDAAEAAKQRAAVDKKVEQLAGELKTANDEVERLRPFEGDQGKLKAAEEAVEGRDKTIVELREKFAIATSSAGAEGDAPTEPMISLAKAQAIFKRLYPGVDSSESSWRSPAKGEVMAAWDELGGASDAEAAAE